MSRGNSAVLPPDGSARPPRLGQFVVFCLITLLGVLLSPPGTARAQGILQDLRDDVRNPPASGGGEPNQGASQTSPQPSQANESGSYWPDCDWNPVGALIFFGATSPFWLPHAALHDNYSTMEYFPLFPYEDVPGYLTPDHDKLPTRYWGGRLSLEYLDPFDHLDRIGGRLLLETVTRFGLDSQVDFFRETLPDGRHDQLWLGDCNVVFRFAQCEFAEFRAGVGFNWMSDSIRDDFGFNFTYGADFFPGRPWVISTDLDLGTLGHAELFRFRATIGITVRQVEFYTGYEYTDIERMHLNSLIGGVRIWF